MAILDSPDTWQTVTDAGGELVNVPLQRGVSIKMRKQEAVAKGLWPAENKAQPPAQNKMKQPGKNKRG